MNILSRFEIEGIKNAASRRVQAYLAQEEIDAGEELKLVTSAQTLLFLSLMGNDSVEISSHRLLCASIFEKIGIHASTSA